MGAIYGRLGELVLGLLMGDRLWWGEAHRSKAGGYAIAHQNLPNRIQEPESILDSVRLDGESRFRASDFKRE